MKKLATIISGKGKYVRYYHNTSHDIPMHYRGFIALIEILNRYSDELGYKV